MQTELQAILHALNGAGLIDSIEMKQVERLFPHNTDDTDGKTAVFVE